MTIYLTPTPPHPKKYIIRPTTSREGVMIELQLDLEQQVTKWGVAGGWSFSTPILSTRTSPPQPKPQLTLTVTPTNSHPNPHADRGGA